MLLALALACAPKDAAPLDAAAQPAPTTGPLVLDGTPPIPDELTARMHPYLETRRASLVDLADDGSEMLVLTRFANTNQLHRVRHPGGSREQLTFRDEPVRGAGTIPGHDDLVVFRSDEGGNEQHQLFVLDTERGAVHRLTSGEGQHSDPLWAPSGQLAVFTSTERNGKDFDLWTWDGQAEAPHLAVQVEGAWEPLAWLADSRHLVVQQYLSITDSPLWLVDLQDGDKVRLSPEEPVAAYANAATAPGRLWVTTDREGEFVELYEIALPDGEPDGQIDPATLTWTPLTRDIPWNVEGLAASADGSELAFTVNEGGASVLYIQDDTGRHRVEGIAPGVIRGLRFAHDAPVLGFSLYASDSPGDAWTYDPDQATLTRWTTSETGGIDPSTFITPELVHFPSFDDRRIPAWYYRPHGEGPFPTVIAIHGGPESQARPYFSYRTQFMLRELGVAVLVPNVRGSAGYGKSWLKLDNGPLREDSVKDIGALLDWIDTRPELDASRVGVTGGSYGGYMVLASLATYPERIRAGVDVVGIANFVTFLEHTRPYRQDLRRAEYGDERDPEMRAIFERISPVHSADRIRSALFVAHGANDPRVPAEEAEQIVQAVRAQGNDAWFMLAMNEGHGFRKKENADMYAMLQALFFQHYLLDEAP